MHAVWRLIFGMLLLGAMLVHPAQASARPMRPALAPTAFSVFCVKNPPDCRRYRDGKKQADRRNLHELTKVNALVNAHIKPQSKGTGPGHDVWQLAPERGDCNDYAVTKRHVLMMLGWSSEALRLAVVLNNRGEGHLVVMIPSRAGNLVLDNLTSEIRPMQQTGYRLVKLQAGHDPQRWLAPVGAQHGGMHRA